MPSSTVSKTCVVETSFRGTCSTSPMAVARGRSHRCSSGREARTPGRYERTVARLVATVTVMSDPKILRAEVDGREATAEQLRFPAFSYGHFTAMQIRERKVRGLGLHLTRLDAANRELFGAGLDGDVVSDHIRHALGDMADASIRVYVGGSGRDEVSIMVTVRGPIEVTTEPIGIMTVPYQRSEPHIKHLGDHGQVYHRRCAELAGFDDALLTGPDGVVSECGIANIAFFDGTSVVWPDAPALQGITMQLVEPRLADGGVPSRRGPLNVRDLAAYGAAFVTNARGIVPVGRIDDTTLTFGADLMRAVAEVYKSVAWDTI
jgi:branched-subunit amino acid aminotransferase/4-amino-4-deoxychorismate lyase